MHVGTAAVSCDNFDRPVADPILLKFYIYNIIIALAISAPDEKKMNNKIIILIMRYAVRVLCVRASLVFGQTIAVL